MLTYSFARKMSAALGASALLMISCGKAPTASNSQATMSAAAPVDYSPRIGVAVRTNSRTCVAIKNSTLQGNSPVTLVLPGSPQTFVEAQVSGPSQSACPITEAVDPMVSNYEIAQPQSSNVPKMMALIAVVGTAASSGFLVENVSVQADLDQTHAKNTFRACGANDGMHLTAWRGIPITGSLVWKGYYFESGNPGTLPQCTPAEMAP